MYTKKSLDRYSLIEVYNNIKECECQSAAINTGSANIAITSSLNSDEKTDMVLNNLININNKAAELVQSIQNALQSNEEIDHWVSEKIAIMANTIGTLADYYVKYKDVASVSNSTNIQSMPSTGSLKLEPMTVAASFPLNTAMPPMVTSF